MPFPAKSYASVEGGPKCIVVTRYKCFRFASDDVACVSPSL